MTDDSEGWSAIPNWLLRDPAVDRNVKMVYLVLSGRVGRNRVCWPSQVTIANEAGVSVPTVKRTIPRMVEMGLLSVEVERTKSGRRNLYRLHVHPFYGGGMGSP
jgi:DNA-binding MarR family transcriptional regulator